MLIVTITGCAGNSAPSPKADTPQAKHTADATAAPSATPAAEPISPISPILPTATTETLAPVSPISPTPAPTAASDSRQVVFSIVPGPSNVTYTVDELLLAEGDRQATVTGSTDQITGQIQLDYDNPTQSTFGSIFVRVLSMRTDNPKRDRSLLDQWPDMIRFPFAMFQITEVRGFPESFQIGQSAQFQLVGTLNLKSVARPVVWDTTATLLGNQITGAATTTLSLTDYDIPVPLVKGLHQVMESVTITVNFTLQEASTLPEKPHT